MSGNKFGMALALKEHLASGSPITRLEAMLYFGVPNLTSNISKMRKEGWILKSRRIKFSKVISRVNKFLILKPPKNLPINEIQMIEYWVEK